MTLAFVYASEAELGIDPWITYKQTQSHWTSESERGWWIKARGTNYRIVEVLDDYRSRSVYGRGTRIFRAKKASDDEDEIVIKDTWREYGRKTEDEIQRDILAALDTALANQTINAEICNLAKNAFFTHDPASGDIAIFANGAMTLDSTEAMITRNGETLPLGSQFPSQPLRHADAAKNVASGSRSNKRTRSLQYSGNPTYQNPGSLEAASHEQPLRLRGPFYRQHFRLFIIQFATPFRMIRDLRISLHIMKHLVQC
jgi:hypothetical protein